MNRPVKTLPDEEGLSKTQILVEEKKMLDEIQTKIIPPTRFEEVLLLATLKFYVTNLKNS